MNCHETFSLFGGFPPQETIMPQRDSIDCRTARAGPIDDPVILAHLQGCADCREATKSLRASWDALGVIREREPSPLFYARVMAKIAREQDRPPWHPSRLLGLRRVWWAALAPAVAVTALVLAGVWDRAAINAPSNGSEVVADLELVESEELLQHLEVVEDLDLLLLMDQG